MNIPEARKNIDLAYGRVKKIRTDWGPGDTTGSLTADCAYAMKRLIDAKNALKDDAPPPPPPVPFKRQKGAMVITSGNASVELLKQAGITRVALDIENPGNLVAAELARWRNAGIEVGAFFVSRSRDHVFEAAFLQSSIVLAKMTFAIVDTEAHKADMPGGSLQWTEDLYLTLRGPQMLGGTFPLFNITYGRHSSPAVVNHEALRRHNVKAVWEAYDANGVSDGVPAQVAKANLEGWNPAHVAIGDKSIPADVQAMSALSGLGDVWVWAPEQSGADVLELAKVPV